MARVPESHVLIAGDGGVAITPIELSRMSRHIALEWYGQPIQALLGGTL